MNKLATRECSLTTEFQLINVEIMMELELGNHHSKNSLRQVSPIDTKISG